MKTSTIALLAAAILTSAAVAHAGIVVGTAGDGFQTFGTPDENGTPFWDNPSLDGPHQNIGYQVLNTYGSVLPWWGTSAGGFDPNFHFDRGASSGSVSGALKLEIASYSNANEVGWYDITDPSHTHHVIWTGTDSSSSNASQTFTPSVDWGLYISGPGGTFYSNSSLNSVDTSTQHFAVFATTPLAGMGSGNEAYYIGAEDLPATTNTYEKPGDYNDFIFTIASVAGINNVPEPASLAILVLGAAGLLLRRPKGRRASAT